MIRTHDTFQNELEKLSYKEFTYHGIENEFKGHIRFVLNYTIYLIELLDAILNQFKVDETIISGWDSVDITKHKSSNVFVIYRIIIAFILFLIIYF